MFVFLVECVDRFEVLVDEDVTIGDKEGLFDFVLEELETAGCPERFVFHEVIDVVLGSIEVFEVILDHVGFVIDGEVKLLCAHPGELLDDQLEDRFFSDGDEGLGDDVGDGLESTTKSSGHDDDREVECALEGGALCFEEFVPKDQVVELFSFVEDGHKLHPPVEHERADMFV